MRSGRLGGLVYITLVFVFGHFPAFGQEATLDAVMVEEVPVDGQSEATSPVAIDESQVVAAPGLAVTATAATAATNEEDEQIGLPALPTVNVVGAGGEFTQRVEIATPEFRNLPLPLALRYNSSDIGRSGPDKIVAFGWSLGGVSVIERKSLGGGVPSFDDGQDLYLLDGQELMACKDTAATNPWPSFYPLRYLTDRASASCSAGGNLASRVEDFQRIKYDTVTNRFTVVRPDGTQLTYASIGELAGDASAANSDGWLVARKTRWVLTEIRDTQATPNIVTYSYAFAPIASGYAERLVAIDYAGYKVTFHYRDYSSRGVLVPKYATGTAITGAQDFQLRSIRVYDGAAPIRAYQLNHSNSALTKTQLLTSVVEYGSDFVATGADITGGSALPATTFGYTPDTVSFFEANTTNTPSLVGKEFHENVVVIDSNLDGADDLAFGAGTLYRESYSGENGYSYPITHTFQSGLFAISRSRALVSLRSLNSFCGTSVPGYNIEGTPDPRRRYQSPGPVAGTDRSTDALYCFSRRVSHSQSTGGLFSTDFSLSLGKLSTSGPAVGGVGFTKVTRSGTLFSVPGSFINIDLDPGTEVVWQGRLYDVSMGQVVDSGPYSGVGGSSTDFTGDGVDDWLTTGLLGTTSTFSRLLPESGYYAGVLKARASIVSFPQLASSVPYSSSNPVYKEDLLGFGDIDGNGLSDFVFQRDNGTAADSLVVFTANGRGFGTPLVFSIPNLLTRSRGYNTSSSPEPDYQNHRSSLRDINSDGLTDIIIHTGFSGEYRSTPYVSSSSWVLLNNGAGFSSVPVNGSTAGFPGLVAIGDFDGDGLQDIAREGSSGTILFGNGGIPNRLVSVVSPAGSTTTITYAPSSDFGTNQMPGIQQVVKTITTNDGRGGVSTVEYRYVGGRYDFIARQTLGYRTVTAILPPVAGEAEGPQVVTTYLNDHLAEYGLVKSRIVLQAGVALSREIFDYTIQKTGNGPWRADRTSERRATLYGTALVETMLTRAYDGFGQIIRETNLGFTADGTNLDPSDDVTVTMGYVANLAAYIVDRPSFRREEAGLTPTATLADDLSYAAMSYDAAASSTTAPARGNLTKVEEWTGTTAALTLRTAKTLTYDAWGNVLGETDAKGNTTSYTYDTVKRLFRLTTTNALAHVETVAWNTLCQAPSTVTDPNSRVTTKTYDIFCRETRTDLPGGQYLVTRYVAFGTPTLQHVERETKSGSATPGRDLSISREYFDGLGRVWAKLQPGTTSAIADAILQLSAYDARGNLAWTSLPLPFSSLNITPNAALRTSFTYDGLGRSVDTLLPDGAKRSLAYLTVSLSHYGGPTLAYPATRAMDEHCFDATGAGTICGEQVQVTDAAGRLIRADRNDTALTDLDAGGQALRSTSYRYDRKGSLIGVTDPGGITFAYTYDVFGNRLTADDPGLGFWTLSYDANNNLLTQTDAKGQLISFAYDALNRVTLKTVGTGPTRVETRFTYDEVRVGFYNRGKETTQEVWTPTATVHKVFRDWHLMGGLAEERHRIDGRAYALVTTYAPNGAPLDQKLPGTPGATNSDWIGALTYDAAGRVTGLTGFVTSVAYNAWGQPTNILYANGVSEGYVYNPSRGWLTSVTGTLPGGDTAFRATYERSATGRIFRTDTQGLVGGTPTDLGGSYDYAYDYTGRLLSATNWRGVTAFSQVFAFDRAGRIRLKGPTLALATTYAYTDPLKPDHAPSAVTTAGVTTTFTYDANGNMLTGLGGKIMTYDGENRPLSVTWLGKLTCYVYGVDGKRLKKVEGLPPTQDCTALPATAPATVYFGPVEIRSWKIAEAEQVLTYPHPAVKLLNGLTPAVATYLHRDGLGSVRAITSATGVKIESALHKPFGEQSEWLLPGNAAPETKGWIGERYDADAGLQYLNARYYDPELSLFLQPDWFEVTKAGVGTNRFSYSFNDPVNGRDANGNCVWDACIAESYVATAAFVAIVGYLATDAIDNGKIDASHVGSTIDALNLGQEGFSIEPGAGEPQVLANPLLGGFQDYVEGMTAGKSSGPIVLADPWGEDYGGALDGRILSTTPGSYEIYVEKDGEKKIYVGKGDEARMKESERRHRKEGYKVIESEWEKAKDHRSAFKDEDRKMQQHAGDERSKSKDVTNKIDSPGKKYREEDDD